MLRLAILFLVVALIAAFLGGFAGISHYSWQGASSLFFVSVVLGLLALLARALKWPYA